MSHSSAARRIKKLAVHAKANKLTGHPTKGPGKAMHKDAVEYSKEAHEDSHDAIKYDHSYNDHPHMDHTAKLKKALGKQDSHHKNLD